MNSIAGYTGRKDNTMSKFSLIPLFDLQLFAEDGAAGTGGRDTATLARPQTGA